MSGDILSTYRLQFHKGFTFRDAAAIVPYLHDLGITHVYASPYLKAVTGSTHGYDVIDHSQFNPEIGTREDFNHFVATLERFQMSHILDTVPNHMGVDTNDNHWWNDVLTYGRQSKHANYFDIDWEGFASRREPHGKVLLPVLGEPLSQAISKGSLQLKADHGRPYVEYLNRRFPIDPHSETNASLDELLSNQHYRLSYWRVGADEINYRRFFDISGLAALQMQKQEVFDDVHRFTFTLIAEGSVAGLRIDHPDGLLDPKQYFERLQATFKSVCPRQASQGRPLFVSVEKILNGDERLREDWPVAGTSGYDFVCAVNDLFVDTSQESAITDIYARFVGDDTSYADWVYREKCLVLDTAMYSEMQSLTNRLDALAQSELTSRDFSRRQLHEALREVIACFTVYRSYVSSEGASDEDAAVVKAAVSQAAGRNPAIDSSVLEFIHDSVLLRYPVKESAKAKQLDFAQRFQQLTSPVNAKGIEDSTFYIYNRLMSLNEVGGDPSRFGRGVDAIHAYLADRQAHWPLALSSLSTHDTKRSEDVRARISVLSEMPYEWEARLTRWSDLNKDLVTDVHPNDQYLLYQTLIGTWPHVPLDDTAREELIQRVSSYMQKAVREAKLRSSWTRPDTNYEEAVSRLVADLLNPASGAAFLADFVPFQKRISLLGLFNSLSQTVIRLTAPGICDTYQGSELLDLSLVDPDNRRPVNYELRRKLLRELNVSALPSMTAHMEDGRLKLWLHRQLLHFRRQFPDLFLRGRYEPIACEGAQRSHVFAFARIFEGRCSITVVPRLLGSLAVSEEWGVENWDDTRIAVPRALASSSFIHLVTEEPISCSNGVIYLSQLFKRCPVAVLACSL